jgi:hypothetical protein
LTLLFYLITTYFLLILYHLLTNPNRLSDNGQPVNGGSYVGEKMPEVQYDNSLWAKLLQVLRS